MFPLGLAVITALGFLIGPESKESDISQQIASVLPVSSELIGSTMEGIVSARTITGIASFLGLVWASSAVFGAVRKGINTAWGVTTPRPFLRERMIDIALVLGAGMLVLIVLFTAPIIEVIRGMVEFFAIDGELPADLVWEIIAQLVSPVLIFLSFMTLYRWIPNTNIHIIYVVPGAFLASLVFISAQMGFIWYIGKFSVYNVVYGSIGALMALLAWIYVSAIILLFGAQITSMFHEYATRAGRPRGSLRFWTGLGRVRVRVVPSRPHNES